MHQPASIPGYTYGSNATAIVVPMKSFLSRKGHPPEVVDRMYDAWWKSVILQVTLWSQPYVRQGDF